MSWEDILELVNIVDYVQQYTDLKEENGELWGICPLHNENTASFCVNEEKQTYYCFGCNSGGNLISFIMQYDDCTCADAIQKIKKFYNITDEEYKQIPNIVKILRKFKKFVKENKEAHREEIPDYILKNNNNEKITEWIAEGISSDIMKLFGVRYYTPKNIIAFEVRDNNGTLISFKERTLYENYKELKIPKYTHSNEIGQNDILWGFYLNKNDCILKNEIILFEGEKSVMKLMTWGINNCAALGTSHLNDEQLSFLIKSGLNVVVAVDKHVQKDAFKNEKWNKLKRYCKVYIIYDKMNLLDEKDAPVDKGKDVWLQLYQERRLLK